jgi:hypothetical protein
LKYPLFIIILFSVIYTKSNAQILDDSTKQIYSLKTVKYILEDDILNNKKTLYNPDSLLEGFHLFNFIQREGNLYQHLGNDGTPLKSLFYQTPQQVGRLIGYFSLTPYSFNAREVKYFNTKSPYTNMYYVQNTRGFNTLRFTHSQNIKPNLNFGLDVRRMKSSKQYGAPRTSEDNLIDSWAFNLNSNYESKNQKYIILTNFNHFNHLVNEQGGIQPLVGDSISREDLGRSYRQFLAKLSSASSREWWNELHIYHQYEWLKGLQFYHILDYHRSKNYFQDDDYAKTDSTITYYSLDWQSRINNLFYSSIPAIRNINDILGQRVNYNLFENRFGVKGAYKGFNYRLHLRQRFLNNTMAWEYPIVTESISEYKDIFKARKGESLKTNFAETIVGGWASYYFPDSVRKVFVESEIGVGKNVFFQAKGEYFSNNLRLGANFINTVPTIIQNQFIGNIYRWNNSFQNVTTLNFYGNTTLKLKNLTLTPSGEYSLITNYIYFDTEAKPIQANEVVSVLRAGLGVNFNKRRWTIFNQFYIAPNAEKGIFRMPLITNNTRISFDFIYAKVLKIKTGIEVYYRTAYYADNYMPVTRQFYLQNDYKVWGYPVVDAFADLMVNKVRLFFKYSHLNQLAFGTNYYVTPSYPGLPGTFYMGCNWPLFD